MAFIQANWDDLDTKISINTDHIVAVYSDNEMTIIKTPYTAYSVKESYVEIVKRIESAQVYGPK